MHAILSIVMKSHAVLLRPTRDVSRPFVLSILPGYTPSPVSHTGAFYAIRSTVTVAQWHSTYVQITLILLNNGPNVQEQ